MPDPIDGIVEQTAVREALEEVGADLAEIAPSYVVGSWADQAGSRVGAERGR